MPEGPGQVITKPKGHEHYKLEQVGLTRSGMKVGLWRCERRAHLYYFDPAVDFRPSLFVVLRLPENTVFQIKDAVSQGRVELCAHIEWEPHKSGVFLPRKVLKEELLGNITTTKTLQYLWLLGDEVPYKDLNRLTPNWCELFYERVADKKLVPLIGQH